MFNYAIYTQSTFTGAYTCIYACAIEAFINKVPRINYDVIPIGHQLIATNCVINFISEKLRRKGEKINQLIISQECQEGCIIKFYSITEPKNDRS